MYDGFGDIVPLATEPYSRLTIVLQQTNVIPANRSTSIHLMCHLHVKSTDVTKGARLKKIWKKCILMHDLYLRTHTN